MLKRANKVAALLVVAASITSIIPAMAATTTIQKLNTKDGTIEKAVAFSNGNYVYQGYKNSDDDSIYYTTGDKDKQLDDIENADIQGAYSTKYTFAKDGSDEYLIDLSNGSVTDSITPQDDLDITSAKLKATLKKTDRYGLIDASAVSLTRIEKGPKFGDVWYSYTATPLASADGKSYTLNGKLFGFTNEAGKYIDISTTANIYTYSATKGKTVAIKDFTNNYTNVDSDTKLSATLAEAPQLLTQDKDNFYVKVKVNIYDSAAKTANLTGSTVAASTLVSGDTTGNVLTSHTYIQKISKAQGTAKDGAYLPKTVESYEVTKSIFDSSDADNAYDALNSSSPDYSVANGQLLVINKVSNNVKVTSINLKKDKVSYKVSNKPTTSKIDAYLAEKSGSDNVDVTSSTTPYDIDVDGNVWVVSKGKVYEFKSNTMTKVYSCDSSFDSINIYDANNLITWKENGHIYSTASSKGTDTSTSGTSTTGNTTTGGSTNSGTTTTTKKGWDKSSNGTWNYYDATGAKVSNKWIQDGSSWYFLKSDSSMATGWITNNGTWYYLASSGAMKTGWLNDGGTWYYLNSSGAMLSNTTVDGYKLSSSGAWIS